MSGQKNHIRTVEVVILIQDQVLHHVHPAPTLVQEVLPVLHRHTGSQAVVLLTGHILDPAVVVPTGLILVRAAVARVVHLQAIQEVEVVAAILHRVDPVVQVVAHTVAEVHPEVQDHHQGVRLLRPEVLHPEVAEDRNLQER